MNIKNHSFFFIISLIFNIQVSAQDNNIQVIYKVYPKYGSIENDENIKSKKIPDLYKGVDDAIEKLEYELNINKNKSHFFLKDILYTDKKTANLAISFAGRESVYTNKDLSQYIKIKYILNEKYLVSFIPEQNWVLTTEKKIIQGFICYKATQNKTWMMSKNKSKTYKVEAWYCPELPYSYGPKDFTGLPGLILELQEDKVIFIASKIELNTKKNISPDIKIDQKIINEKEFYDLVSVKAKDYFDEKLKRNK